MVKFITTTPSPMQLPITWLMSNKVPSQREGLYYLVIMALLVLVVAKVFPSLSYGVGKPLPISPPHPQATWIPGPKRYVF